MVVLATGYASQDEMDETWEFDGTSWRQVYWYAPSKRDGAAMVYDAGRGRMVLYGGNGDPCSGDQGNYNCNDTLEYVVIPETIE